jgi:hypothetical protein
MAEPARPATEQVHTRFDDGRKGRAAGAGATRDGAGGGGAGGRGTGQTLRQLIDEARGVSLAQVEGGSTLVGVPNAQGDPASLRVGVDGQMSVEAVGVVEPAPASYGQPRQALHVSIMDPGPAAPPGVLGRLTGGFCRFLHPIDV